MSHENVAAWLDTIDDTELTISVISVREISNGLEKKRKSDDAVANVSAKAADAILAAYLGRILCRRGCCTSLGTDAGSI